MRALTDGYGVHSVLERVGLAQAMQTAIEITRPGGAVGRPGDPQEETMRASRPAFCNNVSVGGGRRRRRYGGVAWHGARRLDSVFGTDVCSALADSL